MSHRRVAPRDSRSAARPQLAVRASSLPKAGGRGNSGGHRPQSCQQSHKLIRRDVLEQAALKRLVATGTLLRPFSDEFMEACLKATNELWTEISAKNADFKKSIEAVQAYRNDQYLWWQVAEYTNDSSKS
jgi:hypothetical protein